MNITKKKYIFIFLTLSIVLIFLSLFFGLFDQKNNLEINQLDENMCKYHYASLLKENFSNTSVILDIQYKSKGLSNFPGIKNILSKQLGSNNLLNNARATINGLSSLRAFNT